MIGVIVEPNKNEPKIESAIDIASFAFKCRDSNVDLRSFLTIPRFVTFQTMDNVAVHQSIWMPSSAALLTQI